MTKIGYFVPEFPGQTHIFFWREMKKLRQLGVEPEVVSTRRPAARIISHDWADGAMEKTEYLFPPSAPQLTSAFVYLLKAGPMVWLRCLSTVFAADGVTLKQRIRLFAMILLGARLSQLAGERGWTHLHVHSCADAANIALFANRISNLPYSMTLHGPLGDYGPNQKQKWRHSKFSLVITRLLHGQVHQALQGCLPSEVPIAPMGVELDTFSRKASEFEPWRGEGPFRVFACGRINRCKGHEYLIQAIADLRKRGIDAQLQIAGAIDSENTEYSDELSALIQQEQLSNHVEFLGAVSEEVIRERLEAAHVFALASLHEPLGVVYMEAMAMSVPVVTTNAGGVCELIEDGKQGLLVRPEAHEPLADALAEIAGNPEAAVEFGVAGRKVVEGGFHAGVSAKTIAEHLGVQADDGISTNSDDRILEPVTANV